MSEQNEVVENAPTNYSAIFAVSGIFIGLLVVALMGVTLWISVPAFIAGFGVRGLFQSR